MSSEPGDRRLPRIQHGGTHPPEPEHLPCPRCDSTNTKFCYYNNYNLSQPRHFCKSCRRYWTRGGTLRNVPVGGGTRRNANKRSRTATPSSSSSVSYDPMIPSHPISMLPGIKTETASLLCADMNLNENVPGTESFSSLLNPPGPGTGFFALERFGIGLGTGSGFREMGFGGFGDGVWHTEEVGCENGGGGGGGGSVVSSEAASGCNAWQIGSVEVEGGLADGDCFGWPDLAISTPGKGGLN